MPAPGDSVNRVILSVDVKGFSRPEWTDRDRDWILANLDDCLAGAFRDAGLDDDEIMGSRTETGDGAFYFIDAAASRVIDSVGHLRRRLRRFNRRVAPTFRIRIRVAVSAGSVIPHGRTMIGDAVNLTGRLLDSTVLRNRLNDDWPDLVFMVSEHVFAGTIATEHSHHFEKEYFGQARVDTSEGTVNAWVLKVEFTRPDPYVPPIKDTVGVHLLQLARRPVRVSRRRAVPLWTASVALVLAVTLVVVLLPRLWPDPCQSPVTLPILADPGMAEPLNQIADTLINPAGECRRADVHVYAADSADAAVAAVASGWQAAHLSLIGPEPAVWMPGAASEVAQVRALPNIPALDEREPIAKGAVVVAMTPEQRNELGLDRRAKWNTLLDLALSSGGPRLRLIRANPTVSTAALLGTMAMYGSVQESPDAAAQRHEIEQVIEPAADTEIATLCAVAAATGQEPPYAAVTTVQAVNNYNRSKQELCGPSHRDAPDLQAIYPAEGTYVQDYQYVLLPAAARDLERKELAEELHEKLRSNEGQMMLRDAGLQDLRGRIDERWGALANEPQSPLSPPDGPAVIDSEEQWRAARRPVAALLAIDVSGSMVEPMPGQNSDRMTAARDGLSQVIQQIPSPDRVGLWEFSTLLDGSHDHRQLVPVQPIDAPVGGRSQRDEILDKLDDVQAIRHGDTGLNDTIIAGMATLRAQADDETLNALIVLTDGLNADPAGGASIDRVIQEHNSSDPPVHIILLTFGTAACDSQELTQLMRPQFECIDAGSIGMDRASKKISDALWGTPP